MMRTGSSLDRAPYLSIGVFAQKMIDGLIAFVEFGRRENLDALLAEALESLKAATGGEEDRTSYDGVRPLVSYERMRTYREVIPTHERREGIVEALDSLLKQRGNQKQQRKSAEAAIRFFYDLEARALRNFDQPDEPSPRGIRELCRAT